VPVVGGISVGPVGAGANVPLPGLRDRLGLVGCFFDERNFDFVIRFELQGIH
jgi:hypothetical protein